MSEWAFQDISKSVGAMRVEDAEKNARRVRVEAECICGARAAVCCRLASLAAESIQGREILPHSCTFLTTYYEMRKSDDQTNSGFDPEL